MSSSPGRTRCERASNSLRRISGERRGLGAARLEHVQPALEVALLGGAEVRDRLVGERGPSTSRSSVDASTRRTSPRRPRSRRRAPSRSRPRGRASRAAPSRASRGRPAATARRPRPASRAGRPAPAARCRRASSRSGGPSRSRRPRSARTRRRPGRRSRRAPSPRASRSDISRSPRTSRNSITDACGNFGARPEAAVLAVVGARAAPRWPSRDELVADRLGGRLEPGARAQRRGGSPRPGGGSGRGAPPTRRRPPPAPSASSACPCRDSGREVGARVERHELRA